MQKQNTAVHKMDEIFSLRDRIDGFEHSNLEGHKLESISGSFRPKPIKNSDHKTKDRTV
jgi:hypothetical protein